MLDLQLARMVAQAQAAGLPDLCALPPQAARGLYREILAAADVPPADVQVRDLRMPRPASEGGGTIGLRVYRPHAAAGALPLVFAPNTINSGGAFLRGPSEVPGGHVTTDVRVVALDQLDLPRPVSFIKADIEGAEPLAFRGGEFVVDARGRTRTLRKLDGRSRPLTLDEPDGAVAGFGAAEDPRERVVVFLRDRV